MNMKRMRGRSHRGSGSSGGTRSYNGNYPLNRNHVFDSSGPDLRIRGTAQQLFEKYLQLGRDATGAGDRVMAESYFQHAEHYFRILNAINQAQPQQHQQQHAQHQGQGQGGGQGQYQQNGHYRRPTQEQYGGQEYEGDGQSEQPGFGDQPGAESREIPIAASAPES